MKMLLSVTKEKTQIVVFILKKETANILYAINTLSKLGYLNTTLLLSSSDGYQKIKLPMEEEDIDKIDFAQYASEGLERTMTHNIKLLQNSKNIIVITDGNIEDQPIDKTKFNNLNIRTLAIYISKSYDELYTIYEDLYTDIQGFTEEQYLEHCVVEHNDLTKWFDKAIVRNDVLSVIKEIVNQGFRA